MILENENLDIDYFEIYNILKEVIDTLIKLKEINIHHFDIKPSNILIVKDV